MRYFVMEPCKQLGDAEMRQFGSVIYLFPGGTRRAPMHSREFRESIIQRLTHHAYNPSQDAFVCVGANVPLLIATNQITATYGEWRAMVWDSRDQDYFETLLGDTRQETDYAAQATEAIRENRRA